MSQLLETARQSLFHHKNQSYYQLMSDLEPDDWTVYPRPQMRRQSYMSLNGEWKIRNQHSNGKSLPDQSIRVPFPPQAALSGYETEDIAKIPEELFYERSFQLPAGFRKHTTDRILLHFGAVDQIAHVFINSRPVGTHEGGYLPFTFDITDYLHLDQDSSDAVGEEKTDNLLQVLAEDHLDHYYPWGKQKKDRGGMWYTPVSGIWQSVWLEAVPENYISELKIEAPASGNITLHLKENRGKEEKADNIPKQVQITIGAPDIFHAAELLTGNVYLKTENPIAQFTAACDREGIIRFNLREKLRNELQNKLQDKPQDKQQNELQDKQQNKQQVKPQDELEHQISRILSLWSPDTPWIYPMRISLGEDVIETYFALRTISSERIGDYTRVCLNGNPIFLNGVLDQGYFSDGLYLPANYTGYIRDLQTMKELGFNLLRKHIKVEPDLYYFYCDCMGMMVMQDMVNNGPYSFLLQTALPTIGLKKQPEAKHPSISKRENGRRRFFLEHSREIQRQLYNHPCIIAYTVFNEGWGQFDSKRVGDELRRNDPSRLYDYTSGWFEHGGSDFESIHEYFHPGQLNSRNQSKVLFLSECGGCTWRLPEHSYSMTDSYGYGTCTSQADLTDHIISLYETMVLPSIATGLCGCIYTQLSDVEDEVNGLVTYDRRITKPQQLRMKELAVKIEKAYSSI